MLLLSILSAFIVVTISTANPDQVVQKSEPNICTIVVCGPAQSGLPGRDGRDGKEGPKGEKGNPGIELFVSQCRTYCSHTHISFKNKHLQNVTAFFCLSHSLVHMLGLPGTAGQQGLPGNPGSPGPKGDKGPVGEKGGKGDKGDRGKQLRPHLYCLLKRGRLQGAIGSQGPTGRTGSSGPKGDKGSQGEKGTKGDSGLSEINLLKTQVSILERKLDTLQNSFSKYKKVIMFPNGRIVGEKVFMTNGYESSFENLKQRCFQAGGQLASPRNSAENTAIQQIVALHDKAVFLGINDIRTEGQFQYLNGQAITYSNWLPGEPNNDRGIEDCVEVFADGKWNDRSCKETRLIICEF
uniref:Pulmonary surfactant-associated protein D-like n=1 Tax=Crocodylus porosus TaxID=8502 RepID=A0A7M4ESV8_CROPO